MRLKGRGIIESEARSAEDSMSTNPNAPSISKAREFHVLVGERGVSLGLDGKSFLILIQKAKSKLASQHYVATADSAYLVV